MGDIVRFINVKITLQINGGNNDVYVFRKDGMTKNGVETDASEFDSHIGIYDVTSSDINTVIQYLSLYKGH